jgi:hypothetical protein
MMENKTIMGAKMREEVKDIMPVIEYEEALGGIIQFQKLFNLIRDLGYGEVLIKVQDGMPVFVEKIVEKYKL